MSKAITEGLFIELTDEELITLTLNGEAKAYEQIYLRYRGQLMNYYVSKVSDPVFAEDLLQKAFLKASLALAKFDSTKFFKPWFFALAYHLLIDELRKNKSEAKLLNSLKHEQESVGPQSHPDASSQLSYKQDKALASQAAERLMGALPASQQRALELRFIEELSYEDIAIHMGIKSSNARQMISRALKVLRSEKKKDTLL